MALFVTCRLTTPARPPAINPPGLPGLPGLPGEPGPLFTWEELLLWPPPKCWREKLRTAPTPLAATRASAIMEPPVCPTFTPRLDMKESIFWDTFKKAMAHRNQTRTLPDTASRPAASTWACASLSEKAKAVWQDRQRRSAIRKAAVSTFLYFFMVVVIPFCFSHSESGFAMNAPTMLVNSRRHQAFMSRRNTCPPNIRHQDLKMLEVDWEAPMENATGAV